MKKVTFLPLGKEISVQPGTDLLQAAALAGVPVEGNCGGKGTCGKCKVKVLEGLQGEPGASERKALTEAELAEGWVLACQRKVVADTVVKLQLSSDAYDRKSALAGAAANIEPEPGIEKIALKLPRPSIDDQTPDLERLLRELQRPSLKAALPLIAGLPGILRQEHFKVTAVLSEKQLLAVEPGDTTARLFGLAFDIGTTTLMGSLMDLRSGAVVAVAAATNPQNIYGADVISRITYASKGAENLAALQRKVIEALNGIIRELVQKSGVAQNEIYEAVAVGNTTMGHLFMGIDPTYLAPAPFIPAFQKALEIEAAELGLAMNPSGRVVLLPNIAGYVGSDTVGVILAAGLDRRGDNCLAVDIGTNGELVLAAKGRLLTCSTAAGPAFEGAQIRCGMRAADGAIEAVQVADDIKVQTIGGAAPRGICGSGLIDAAAALLRAGVIEPSGRFINPETAGHKLPPRLKERMRRGQGGFEIVLAYAEQSATGKDVVLTQADLRELQLAKGAIFAGFKVLLRQVGITEAEVDNVLLAGAFGNYISVESALALGLLPGLPPEKIIPIGNAAGDGAKMALISRSVRERAFALPEKVEHVELSTRQDFQEEFINALAFPQ
ncbi:MAG TPA: ASKHA domain-containing protein [Bacillota bacterium]|nr:ASKHA domain-containing protein [Bacillota bacterium]